MTGGESWIMIPARMASTRLPRKALVSIDGAPLIAHVVRAARACTIGKVIVATDHQDIKAASQQEGAEVIMTPSTLPSGSDRIAHALQQKDSAKNVQYIINLQGDIPFPSIADIRRVHHHLTQEHAPMVTLVSPITTENDIGKSQIVKAAVSWHNDDWGRAVYFSRQAVPASDGAYYHHIGIYGFARATLLKLTQLPPCPLEKSESLEQLRALEHGIAIHALKTDVIPHSIDTPEDVASLEKAL